MITFPTMSDMKAIISSRFGPPSELEIRVVNRPEPKKNQVLIRVMATSINDYDWSMVRGRPREFRFLYGFTKPRYPTPGMELSGIIEDVGPDVTKFKKGDEVYGDISAYGFGTFAEFIAINENAIIRKPKSMSFIDAAALPHASLLAYQALFKNGNIRDGQKILINGGGGGVGMLGLQLCKLHQTEVTGVDTGAKLKVMEDLGFDHVIDYKTNNFTKLDQKYDLILDAKSKHSVRSILNVLTKEGKYVSVGGDTRRILSIALTGVFTGNRLSLLFLKSNEGLEHIGELYLNDKLKPVIDGPYSFDQIPWAIQYFGEGRHSGKVVIDMSL